jgi:hypothetical protein
MKLTSLAFRSAVLLTCFAGVGCAANGAESASEDVEATDEAALVSCGAAKYNEALGHYKKAVAWSKERLASGTCEWENGYLWSIADEASRAVMTCGVFRNTIKTSPWAVPLRTALDETLTLRSLTGDLLVIKDSPWQNWTSTEAFFAKGTTFWAQSNGAYGYPVSVEFKADGKATWGELVYNEVTGDITWESRQATYTIAKIDGTESGKRRVVVKHAGKTTSFTLGVQAGWSYDDAPIFTLSPASTDVPKLFSLKSECDA